MPASLVSVLTVVRNDAVGLAATISSVHSVRKRSNTPIRLIVVDGNSDDETPTIIAANRDLIDALISEPDDGIYDAMNKAASLADPESLLIWINAGDLLLDIDAVFDGINLNEVDAIFAAIRLPGGRVVRPKIVLPYNAIGCYPRTVFRHQGFLIRATAFQRLGGYRLDVGLQAEGLLMSQTILQLRWATSTVPVADFKLDGISNKRHFAILISYLRVTKELGIPMPLILVGQWLFFTKLLLKLIFPEFVTAWILRVRWGNKRG